MSDPPTCPASSLARAIGSHCGFRRNQNSFTRHRVEIGSPGKARTSEYFQALGVEKENSLACLLHPWSWVRSGWFHRQATIKVKYRRVYIYNILSSSRWREGKRSTHEAPGSISGITTNYRFPQKHPHWYQWKPANTVTQISRHRVREHPQDY